MRRPHLRRPALVALAAGLLAAAPAGAEVRTARLVLAGADFVPGPPEPAPAFERAVPDASLDAWLVSPARDAGLAFAAVGSHWPGPAGIRLELSVSPDGMRWGRWIAVPSDGTIANEREDGVANPFGGETLGALVFVDPASRFLRCRVLRQAASDGVPDRVSLHAIDPGMPGRGGLAASAAGTTFPRTTAGPLRRAAAPAPELPDEIPGAPRPAISSRAEWGARPPRTGYTYTLAGHVGLHHTATVEDWAAETWAECAARVRAIQAYHLDTNGWNDIGYAYVVCKHGHVFQAREDDDDATDVQGAHDGFNRGSAGLSALGYFHPPVDQRPTAAQLSALVELTAWIASRRGIDPLGRSTYAAFGGPVDNVYGHRDVSATACPGDHLYAIKESIRATVADRLLRQAY